MSVVERSDLENLESLPKDKRGRYLAALPPERKEKVLAELQTRKFRDKYQDNPARYIRDELGDSLNKKQEEICQAVVENKRIAIHSCISSGKALALETPIPTPAGWTTMGSVGIGDEVYDELGKPCVVIAKSPIWERPSYKVTFDDDSYLITSDNHLWCVLPQNDHHRIQNQRTSANNPVMDWREYWDETEIISTKDLIRRGVQKTNKGKYFQWHVLCARPLQGVSHELTMPPYVLGYWLGDGTSMNSDITVGRQDKDETLGLLRAEGMQCDINHKVDNKFGIWLKKQNTVLRELGVLNNKHIPTKYLRASAEDRMALLQGIMDSDGTAHKDNAGVAIDLCNKQLAHDVAELVRSFGWKCAVRERDATLNGKIVGTRWRMNFCPDRPVFRLKRKASKQTFALTGKPTYRVITSVEEVPTTMTQCIQVDSPRGVYLAGTDMIPTHNSFLIARLALWWGMVYPVGNTRVAITSMVFRQVKDNLFQDIRNIQSKNELPGFCNLTEWKIGDQLVASGFSSRDDKPEGVQGLHIANLLIIIDEAGGMSPTFGAAIDGCMTGPNTKLILTGNPPLDVEGSYFEQCCNSPLYKPIRISAYDTPNFTDEKTDMCQSCAPGTPPHNLSVHLISKDDEASMIHTYGKDSPVYISKIMGEFPRNLTTKTIPLQWILDATDENPTREGSSVTLGVDIASDGGDELVIARKYGNVVTIEHTSSGDDNQNGVDVAGKILEEIRKAEKLNETVQNVDPVKVRVDATGLGWTVVSTLEKWAEEGQHHSVIQGVQFGGKAQEPDKFDRVRSEMWWNGRSLLQPKEDELADPIDGSSMIKLKMSPESAKQLNAPMWKTGTDGRTSVESKKAMRARGIKSPDRADAILLALYEPVKIVKKRKTRLIL